MRRKTRGYLRVLSVAVCSAMLLAAFPASALDRQEEIPPLTEEETAIAIEDPVYSFLIRYTYPNKDLLLEKLQELEGELEQEIDYMRCIAVRVNMDQLAALKEMACVEQVERNYDYNLLTEEEEIPAISDEMRRQLAGEPPARESEPESVMSAQGVLAEASELEALPMNPIDLAYAQNIKGQNVKIALFDTGISPHPYFQITGGVSFVGNRTDTTDENGHGTQMAGIVASSGIGNPSVKGAAPDAELYAVKLVSGDGFITTATILQGIGWALQNDIDIINMSFGTYLYSGILEEAIEIAHEHQILMVGAVGNDGGFADEYRVMYPAAYEHVIAVGAGSAGGTESFSNNNEKLDFVAPGRLDTTALGQQYTHVTGTSASAAYVAGLLANLKSSDPALDNTETLALAKSAAVVASSQRDYVGFGEIRLDRVLEARENTASRAPLTIDAEPDKAERNSHVVLEALEAVEEAQNRTDMQGASALVDGAETEMGNVSQDATTLIEEKHPQTNISSVESTTTTKILSPTVQTSETTFVDPITPKESKTGDTLASSSNGLATSANAEMTDVSEKAVQPETTVSSTTAASVELIPPTSTTAPDSIASLSEKSDAQTKNSIQASHSTQPDAVEPAASPIPAAVNIETVNCFAENKDKAVLITGDIRDTFTYSGEEKWYKFVTTDDEAHPNGSPGYYRISTISRLDTIGYLFNSSGHLIARNDDHDGNIDFSISIELQSYKTYYIRVLSYGGTTGSFTLRLLHDSDDYGNTFNSAHDIYSVYYSNQSIDGRIYRYNDHDDIDYFRFVPARDCVMEIYTGGLTEGNANTVGRLYDECHNLIETEENNYGNGNFKMKVYLEAMRVYYISIGFASSGSTYSTYRLNFKFLMDYHDTISGQYNILLWKNTDNPVANSGSYVEIQRAFITQEAMDAYATRVIEDYPNHKSNLKSAMESDITSTLLNSLRDIGISEMFPNYGDFASLLLNVGEVIYNNMKPGSATKEQYIELWNLINDGTDGYIVGKTSQKKGVMGYTTNTNYVLHGPSSRFYEGPEYQRGKYTELNIQ